MSESGKEADMNFGYLVVFRKGQSSSPYELDEGDHSIGSSRECNIRLKISHPLLMETHALIRVNEDGVATILNKSVGAPVKVNDKIALRPTIIKHEDKFEILGKIFQYFNEHLKDEPEDSQKFLKGKINRENRRQSVHPLTKTPLKKSPNLKMKIPSVRKSTSAVPRTTKGLQVIITPSNKKPDSHIGSKTTSKIIVSKALASPRGAKKRRLSLDNPHKASQIPKISSRNILLSKSTINITISEEHEYSEIVPSTSNRTVQEEDEKLKAITPRRSVKVENGNTPNKTPRRSVKIENGNTPNNDVSVALIDFNSPNTINSPRKKRGSSFRKSAVHQSTLESLDEELVENGSSINFPKTPVNKRIQSLKTVRHSLKKDTPPPKLALPKVIIQSPNMHGKVSGTALNKSSLDDSVTSLVKSPEKSLGTSRSSKLNMSTNYSFHNENAVDPDDSKSSRISRTVSRKSSNVEEQTEDDTPDEGNINKSSRVSRNTSRRSTTIKQSSASFQMEDNINAEDNINKSSRVSVNASRGSRKIEGSTGSSQTDDNPTDVEDNINMSSRLSRNLRVDAPFNSQSEDNTDNTPDRGNVNKSSRVSRNTSRRSTKFKESAASSQTDDNTTDAEDSLNMSSRFSRSLRVDAPFNSQTDTDATDEDNVNKFSRASMNRSRQGTNIRESAASSQIKDDINAEDNIIKSSRVSINASRRSRNVQRTTGSSGTDDVPSDVEDNINMSSRLSRSSRVDAPFNSQSEGNTTDEGNVNKSSRVSRNTSRRSTKNQVSANTSQNEGNINKSSRVSINASRRSRKINESAGSSQTDDIYSDAEDNSSMSSRLSISLGVDPPFNSQSEDNTDNTQDEDNVNQSSIVSRNTSRRSTKITESAASSQIIDNIDAKDNINKSSRVSINASRRSRNIEATTGSSETDDLSSDVEDNINMTSRLSRSLRVDGPLNSQSEDNTPDEGNVNKSSRVSRNTSRRSTKIKISAHTSQNDDNIDAKNNINESSRVSINASRRSRKIDGSTGSSQTDDIPSDVEDNISMTSRLSRSLRVDAPFNSQSEDNTDGTPDEDNINKSSRVSRNTSRRSTKIKVSANTSHNEDNIDPKDNINKSSRLSINASRRSTKIGGSTGSSQTDDMPTDVEDNINMTSRLSRSLRVDAPLNSQSEDNTDDTPDEDNVNKSSRVSRNTSRRSTKIKVSANTSQNEDNIDAKHNINKSSRVSMSGSRRSRKMDASTGSSQIDYNITDAKEHRRSERVSSLSLTEDDSTDAEESADKSASDVQEVSTYWSEHSSRNSSRRSTRPRKSQSIIDSAETTMDVQQKSRNEADITNSTKNKSRQGLSLYDETTQEAKLNASVSKNRSLQRISIFDESTREALPQLNKVKSVKSISILDDTQEVLSPVRPLSPSKSIRNIQNEDRERSVSSSTRVSSIRRSRTKSRTLQDSSLTSTSMDQSSSSVISVSSQSFSSFKKGSSERAKSRDETEIDVVNISSTTADDTEEKRSFRDSGRVIKKEVLDKSNTSRSSRRQTRTSEMFKDVSCTSTPFHKKNSSKETSRESETSDGKSLTKNKSSHLLISISSDGDSVFAPTSGQKASRSSSNIFEETGTVKRRRSSRSSISKGGEHNCVSCRNSSMKRSRSLSLSAVGQSSNADAGNASTSLRPSKSVRKSAGIIHEQIYDDPSPVKKISSAASSKVTTPLLHRISHATSLSEKTPEKCAETEDETPKSSIKPARRSSKSNQSAYNPTVEDITPVTPEKLMTSGFTEDVFKTPINTPGLFENIRKSVIRSRKRHRESTGSAIVGAKRPRVDFAKEEQQLETSTDSTEGQQEFRQTSPLNRLSNFEGVKKLMRTPPKSPKNDLRNVPNLRNLVSPKKQGTPKNDLTNVVGVKKMFSTPKDVKSPRNDLTNVPNLRRLVSPRRQNTPKNDLTQIPNLNRIMSPKQQNSPRNDLSSPAGVKRLLKSPTVQKEPINDLGNVTGVASMFNVSGVEVLHQGSDIENSEDLFTQLTGKRPVKAYPRGNSMSPNKEERDDQPHSRKTMGDIPMCSPRVQQWVEDHANVNYATSETAPGLPLSKDDDVFFNVSEKPTRKSKSGRSVSPKKVAHGTKNRRKTLGDALGDHTNIAAWKQEQTVQAKTRKLSTGRNSNIKTVIISSLQTLQADTATSEKVTPQNLKHKEEIVTPKQPQMTPVGESATPASVRARRGRPKQVDQKKNVSSSTRDETPTIVVTENAPPEQAPKEIENKPLAIKRGLRVKRIMSDQDILALTSASPIQEPPAKTTRTRHGVPKLDSVDTEVDKILPKTRTRRGNVHSVSDDVDINVAPTAIPKTRKVQEPVASELVDEAELKKSASVRLRNKIDDVEATPEISASPVRRGGRRGKQVEEDKSEKPASRSRRGKKIEELVLEAPIVDEEIKKPAVKGRRAKKEEPQTDETNVDDKVTPNIKLAAKGPSRVRKAKNTEDEEPGQNADVVVQIKQTVVKKSSRSRRAIKGEDDEAIQIEESVKTNVDSKGTQKEKVKMAKRPARGRNAKKAAEEAVQIEEPVNTEEELEVVKPTRGRRAKKMIEEEIPANTDADDQIEEPVVNTEEEEVKVVKPTRGRKAKKAVKEEIPANHDSDDQIEEAVPPKTMRSKRGRKGEDKLDAKEKDSEAKVKEVLEGKPKGRGIKNLIKEDAVKEMSDPEVEFRYTRTRSNKGKSQASSAEMAETVASPAKKGRRRAVENKDESVPNPPAAKTVRGRRGAKVVEEVQNEVVVEKNVTEKGALKRKVRFEDEAEGAEKGTPTANTRKSKRTRK